MDSNQSFKFHSIDIDYALSRAYIPEQIPGLMVAISKAAPFIIAGYPGYTKENWVTFIGYPLEGQFDKEICGNIIEQIRETYHPEYLWFIGPEIPPSITSACRARQRDQYYHLDLASFTIKPSLQRQVKRAASKLTVEQSRVFDREHQSLVEELLCRQSLPPMIKELYQSMPDYVAVCDSARVLNARDNRGKLTAFFVVETAALGFDTYILGCYSKKNYVPHASDLLFSEMISQTRQDGKPGINLGLGVNQGIKRFKQKWGGVPVLTYEYCECYYGPPEQLSMVELLLGDNL